MFFITNAIDGFEKIFCYKGVADRKSYFFFVLFQLLVLVLLNLVALIGLSFDNERVHTTVAFSLVIGVLVSFWSLLVKLAMSVRRLHDIGLSGWWVILIFCVTFVAFKHNGIMGIKSADPNWFIDVVNIVVACVVWLGSHLLLALPKSKIENNKYRPADSISIPATDEAVS
ncbi:DUF805 domain-containing protein [Buttiauxella sp. 3AFRM03]|uniref:DUF805 domain-containing protein n=1 Tax=Buttiauxella sp. 3AFRM03 TaxID=2479367 RepID=UPI000EF80874|nr:DUF805 domain-containing protein [Buttiauxella sp. 3AFRM03]AYN30202.1 DUF805 domain-containing protein [Buttiauxella sp. 3AFRM03]